MKAKQFLLIACLPTLLALAGCEPIIVGTPPDFYIYDIYLEVVDADGNSVVRDVPTLNAGDFRHVVRPELYTMEVSIDGKASKPAKIYSEDLETLMLSTGLGDKLPKAVAMKYVIRSSRIFKDDKEHTLTVQWENPITFSPHVCKEVRFDGNVMPVTTDEYGNRATIRIVIDN
ncbi:MAG: hypothetical protein LBJ39_04695 [Tannerellaceae bacterium]|jgi:hypothetical protein|nr:hypothetical protein [Tannerellaceae bacterium]